MTGRLLVLTVILALGAGLVGGLIGLALFSGTDSHLQGEVKNLEQRVEKLEASLAEASVLVQVTTASLPQLQAAVDALRSDIQSLRDELASLEAAPAGTGPRNSASTLKVAYVDLPGLMDEMFQSLQNTVRFKNQELQDLRQKHESGEIDDETYQKESMSVEVELLAAPLNWDLGLIDKMATSPEFSDLKQSLQELREKLQPLQDRLGELKSAADQGDLNTFISLYQQLSTPLQQLDQLVSQVIQAMLADITQEVAQAQGYALVLRKENALYLDESKLADLTPQVKARVPELFSP